MEKRSIREIMEMIETLRGENGCPWDRELTLEAVISSLVEEIYELQWARQALTEREVLDELGDVLFLTCVAAAIFAESHPGVTLETIAGHAYEKIRRRHPHVFGGERAQTKQESIDHWNRVKEKEKGEETGHDSVLGDPRENLPPFRRAQALQERAASVGFDWTEAEGILDKIEEEVGECRRMIASGTREDLVSEVGDLLFSAVNLARFLRVDCESAIEKANAKFSRRFRRMQEMIEAAGKRIEDLSLEEMDEIWEKIKEESR